MAKENLSAHFGMEVVAKGMRGGAALAEHIKTVAWPRRKRIPARAVDRGHKRVIQHRLQLTGAANEVGHVPSLGFTALSPRER